MDEKYLVWLVHLICFWIGETVILVQNDCLDLRIVAAASKALVKWNRQLAKVWHSVMRQADARLEQDLYDIERRREVKVDHDQYQCHIGD